MTNIVDGHDLDTQSGRADYRAAGGWVEGNASGGYSYQNTNTGSSGVGGGTQTPIQGATFNTPGAQQVTSPSTPTATSPTFSGDPAAYARAIQQAVAALNSSDLKAFNEQVREWDKIFGFNQEQFQEGIRQFNQTFGLNEAAVTGTYQGQPTLTAQQIAANYLGTFQGQQTLQAQNQYFNQQLQTAQLAASLQANPFRQAQVLGQASRLLGGQPVAGFQAPNVVAGVGTAGGNTQGGLGYLQQMADDIRNPVPNQTTADQFIAATPTPNKIDSTSFLRSAPSTQNIVLQAMQEKYGLDPADSLKQIQNTLPQFTAPTTFGGVRR